MKIAKSARNAVSRVINNCGLQYSAFPVATVREQCHKVVTMSPKSRRRNTNTTRESSGQKHVEISNVKQEKEDDDVQFVCEYKMSVSRNGPNNSNFASHNLETQQIPIQFYHSNRQIPQLTMANSTGTTHQMNVRQHTNSVMPNYYVNNPPLPWYCNGNAFLQQNNTFFGGYRPFMQHNNYSSVSNNSVSGNFELVMGQQRKGTARNDNNARKKQVYREYQNLVDPGTLKPGFTFSVMNYNVLAQSLLEGHKYHYTHHDKNNLPWKIRWKRLLEEIKTHDCDILCFQEVQHGHLKDYFKKDLGVLGYKGFFKKRTGEFSDGCAIFYKTSTLKLHEYVSVEYLQNHVTLLDRNNVGLVARFSPKNADDSSFVVATTHLLFNPRREDVRMGQSCLLLAEIDRISYRGNKIYHPVIITGDFNSQPNSNVYKLMANGRSNGQNFRIPRELNITDFCQHFYIAISRQKNENLNRDQELKKISLKHSERKQVQPNLTVEGNFNRYFNSGMLNHGLRLKSVYEHQRNGLNEASTFQDVWITVDYIFYSSKSENVKCHLEKDLTLLSRYNLPYANALEGVRIPNNVIGSDHLSLIAKFHLEL